VMMSVEGGSCPIDCVPCKRCTDTFVRNVVGSRISRWAPMSNVHCIGAECRGRTSLTSASADIEGGSCFCRGVWGVGGQETQKCLSHQPSARPCFHMWSRRAARHVMRAATNHTRLTMRSDPAAPCPSAARCLLQQPISRPFHSGFTFRVKCAQRELESIYSRTTHFLLRRKRISTRYRNAMTRHSTPLVVNRMVVFL
jgi:hypothetical protein